MALIIRECAPLLCGFYPFNHLGPDPELGSYGYDAEFGHLSDWHQWDYRYRTILRNGRTRDHHYDDPQLPAECHEHKTASNPAGLRRFKLAADFQGITAARFIFWGIVHAAGPSLVYIQQ